MSSDNSRTMYQRVKEALLPDHTDRMDEEKQEIELQEKKDIPAVSFLREHFKAKVCDSFVPRQPPTTPDDDIDHDSDDSNTICKCGFRKIDHMRGTVEIDSRDSHRPRSTAKSAKSASSRPAAAAATLRIHDPRPTNAFGKITFSPSNIIYRKPAKYVRLANDSNMGDVYDLMVQYWKLIRKGQLRPDVILSLVGGGKHFRLSDSRKKAIFDQALIKAIRMTNGWLLTQGTNEGVAKAIGDAVREGQMLQYDEQHEITRTIHCIGITPWHVISRRDRLINPDPEKINEVQYRVDSFSRSPGLYNLNPDHSHFLLVDDGSVNGEKNIEKFRAKLEKELIDNGIPVISLLIDGGVNSFAQFCDTVEMGTPVFICKGTGRFADIVAEAVSLHARIKPQSAEDENYKSKLNEAIKDNLDFIAASFGDDMKTAREQIFNKIVGIVVEHYKHLNVYDVEKDSLDSEIMEYLLDRKHESQSSKGRLELALRWDAAAIAESKLFTDPNFDVDQKTLANCLETALINDQVEFVKLFADYGVIENKFLTVLQLRSLYNKALEQKEAFYMPLMMKKTKNWPKKGDIYLHHIHHIIKEFTRLFNDKIYANDKPGIKTEKQPLFPQPFQELFIWAVLLNRKNLALFFWENCSDPLSVALLGCLLCSGMKRRMQSLCEPFVAEFQILNSELQRHAVGIVDQAYRDNQEKAKLVVLRPIELIGGLDSLAVAGLANARAYFSSSCCQEVIGEQWKRGFDASGLSIVLSTWLFAPLFLLVRFNKDEEALAIQLLSQSYNEVNTVIRPLLTASEDAVVQHSYQSYSASAETHDIPRHRNLYFYPSNDSSEPNDKSAENKDVQVPSSNQTRCCMSPTGIHTTLCKIVTFYSSPVVKFTLHMTSYMLYLVLYAAVMLFYYPPTEKYYVVTWQEILLYLWQVTFICEMYRTIKTTPGEFLWMQFYDWWRNGAFGTWNRMDCFSIILSAMAVGLRWSATTFPLARLLMLIAMFLYFQRVYKMHFVNSYLGPKVIMLKQMSYDLFMFFLVFTVFMLAYSISVQSLSHPYRPPFWGIIWDIFQQGIWETFGEPQEEAMKGVVDGCNGTDSELSWDCQMRVYPVPVFLAVYLFFGSILLVNMLIAVFAHVFEDVQTNSEEIWRYQMYYVYSEFDDKPFLPPPLIVINHGWRLIKDSFRRLCPKPPSDVIINGRTVSKNELKFLEIFERICRRNFIDSQRLAEKSKLENVVIQLQEKVNKLMEASEHLAEQSEQSPDITASNSISDLQGITN